MISNNNGFPHLRSQQMIVQNAGRLIPMFLLILRRMRSKSNRPIQMICISDLLGVWDLMLCGGSDSGMIPLGFTQSFTYNNLVLMQLLEDWEALWHAEHCHKETTKASHPWDSNHDGFARGEGDGVLPLEELEHGAGVILCIEKALEQSGVSREDANYINAHATSTPAGDLREYNALIHCLARILRRCELGGYIQISIWKTQMRAWIQNYIQQSCLLHTSRSTDLVCYSNFCCNLTEELIICGWD
ncbi:3-oxoacyl-[acyl-carrier-protein] synthase I, chloroplastic isoform X2 [Pyrus x bretschneideri]|uniref:3-oxoacyl-[acyl-carrier-protein] synthase I, chloroplastic isoform X2 n=1 Tax=Pyrus x bretschneideri TaxID=225117 RepID=UPI00202EB171|nr:3-oxoacyl-[acyl-carrier-protein] synthase I, chloroplastic isoform X2 [Pyrus x bretschneideri]